MHANPVNHYDYEGAIIFVHPIATTNKFISSVPHKRTIGFNNVRNRVTRCVRQLIKRSSYHGHRMGI
jgi:hypothetical protein